MLHLTSDISASHFIEAAVRPCVTWPAPTRAKRPFNALDDAACRPLVNQSCPGQTQGSEWGNSWDGHNNTHHLAGLGVLDNGLPIAKVASRLKEPISGDGPAREEEFFLDPAPRLGCHSAQSLSVSAIRPPPGVSSPFRPCPGAYCRPSARPLPSLLS